MGNVQMEARQIRYGSTNVEEAIKNAGGSSELTARVDALETEVEDLTPNVYSTEEVVVGKWGSDDLYRKKINVASFPNNKTELIGDALSNCVVRKLYGIGNNSEITLPLPYSPYENAFVIKLYFDKVSNKVAIETHSDQSEISGEIIIEYTKNPAPEENNR